MPQLAILALISGFLTFSQVTYAAPWRILKDHWSKSDEQRYSEFVQSLGQSNCDSINACLKSSANPYAGSDSGKESFRSDCADLPYTLRGYFAWKNGLPFAYSREMYSRDGGTELRYSKNGNIVATRYDLTSRQLIGKSPVNLLNALVDYVSTAMMRTGPDIDSQLSNGRMVGPDFYPIGINREMLRPGSVLYDPSGHVAVVHSVQDDGRVLLMDAHPDQSITRIVFGEKFGNSRPSHGAGFKNFRPLWLDGASFDSQEGYVGGRIMAVANADLPGFSAEQYLSANWRKKIWQSSSGEALDFYDYARMKLSAGGLKYEPVKEMRSMMQALCSDFRDRVRSVQVAIDRGIQLKDHPVRLPENIYGTSGEWEEYSTPSRDARLKAAAVELRVKIQNLVERYRRGDIHVVYEGSDFVAEMRATYEQEAASCVIEVSTSQSEIVRLNFDDLIARIFAMSFDPYHCVELRWGLLTPENMNQCPDPGWDRRWYNAERRLRNQIDRTYDARMDFTVDDLEQAVDGSGTDDVPDVDLRRYLFTQLH